MVLGQDEPEEIKDTDERGGGGGNGPAGDELEFGAEGGSVVVRAGLVHRVHGLVGVGL